MIVNIIDPLSSWTLGTLGTLHKQASRTGTPLLRLHISQVQVYTQTLCIETDRLQMLSTQISSEP